MNIPALSYDDLLKMLGERDVAIEQYLRLVNQLYAQLKAQDAAQPSQPLNTPDTPAQPVG